MITWFARWGDQVEVDVFGGDLRRTGGSQQGVGEFLAAAGIGEPPRGGIDQGQALHRGSCNSRSPKLPPPPSVARWGRCGCREGTAGVVRCRRHTDGASSRVRAGFDNGL
jgi:hypothetical protein